MCVVSTRKIHFLSKFQVYNAVILTTVTTQYIRPSELVHPAWLNFVPLDKCLPVPLSSHYYLKDCSLTITLLLSLLALNLQYPHSNMNSNIEDVARQFRNWMVMMKNWGNLSRNWGKRNSRWNWIHSKTRKKIVRLLPSIWDSDGHFSQMHSH